MKKIPFGRPIIGDEEKKAVMEVLNGHILVHGPKVKDFEAKFAGFTEAPYAISVSSCTAAMHLAYFDLGLDSGDEVIVPAQTHVATAHAVEFTGAKPVFVDAEIKTGNIDIQQIENAVTEKSKAIAVVHFLGMPVDMDEVNTIAQKYDLFVLEDCALALGTYYKGTHAGLLGDAGCFSFYPVKHMTTAEGGMLTTKDSKLAERINHKKAFGLDSFVGERKIHGVYDVNFLGYNYRMNEIQAALGVEQLRKMNGFLERRQENYLYLEGALREIDEIELFEPEGKGCKSSYYCLSMILGENIASKKFELVNALKKRNIGTSVYYPRPVPHLTYYKNKYGYGDNSFPVASRISYHSVALPVGPHLKVEEMKYIIKSVKESISEVR